MIGGYFLEKSGRSLNVAVSVGGEAIFLGISAVLLLHPSDAATINNNIIHLNKIVVHACSPLPWRERGWG